MKMKSVAILCAVLFTVVISDKVPCKIGDTKRDDCNICECMRFTNRQIGWYCTQWPCPYPQHLFKRSSKTENVQRREQCEVGDTKTGQFLNCTCMSVDKEGSSEWICYERTQNETQMCNEGDTKIEECHTCKCVSEEKGRNKWVCRQKSCLSKDVNKHEEGRLPCKLGTIERRQCHICKCISSIHGIAWKCIKRQCIQNKISSTDNVRLKRNTAVATDLMNTPCALNDSFKIDCNTCYCKSDKTGYLCTDFTCTPEGSNSSIPVNSTTEAVTESINATSVVTLFENTTDSNVASSTIK